MIRVGQGFDVHAFSDDASLVEAIGGSIVLVEGEVVNIKVTSPSDLEMVAVFFR